MNKEIKIDHKQKQKLKKEILIKVNKTKHTNNSIHSRTDNILNQKLFSFLNDELPFKELTEKRSASNE